MYNINIFLPVHWTCNLHPWKLFNLLNCCFLSEQMTIIVKQNKHSYDARIFPAPSYQRNRYNSWMLIMFRHRPDSFSVLNINNKTFLCMWNMEYYTVSRQFLIKNTHFYVQNIYSSVFTYKLHNLKYNI